MRGVIAWLVAVGLLSACAAGVPDLEPVCEEANTLTASLSSRFSTCPGGFKIQGRAYSVDCRAPVRDDALTDTVVAQGRADEGETVYLEARAIAGVSPQEAVAVQGRIYCLPDPYRWAFAPSIEAMADYATLEQVRRDVTD
jgi:hypothetical protein